MIKTPLAALLVLRLAGVSSAIDLPDTTPPGKPHFDTRGAQVGEQLPGLPMLTLDGKPSSLDLAWSKGTTLLLTSSYTCPKSRSTYPHAAALAKMIAPRGVRVAIVYVIEAHPAGDPSPYSEVEDVTAENRRDQILCRQPTTLEQRLALANEFSRHFKDGVPIFVDAMDNAAWLSLGGGPNMGVVIDRNGIVLARQGWFDARSMEQAIHLAIAIPGPAAVRNRDEDDVDMTLHQLIVGRENQKLAAMFDQQPDLERRLMNFYRGQSLLQFASGVGNLDVVKRLIAHGADVNAAYGEEAAPMNLAAEAGALEVLEFLIEHGGEVNPRTRGPTPLQEALFNRHPETANALIKAGAKPNFYTAAAMGDLAALRRYCLADMTILLRPDGRGRTALAYAAVGGSIESAKLLVSLGAHDYAADEYGRNAVYWAVKQENLELVRVLLDAGSGGDSFGIAINPQTSVDFARALLEHKADPNYVQRDGLRPIHLAAGYNRTDILQLLLDAGADIDAVTTAGSGLFCGLSFSKGDTALHVAAKNNAPASLEFLVGHGAKTNLRNEYGVTPLHFAVCNAPEIAEAMTRNLVAHHADVNAATKDGTTPLDAAERANRGLFGEEKNLAAVVDMLKKQGAKNGKAKEQEQ